MRPRAEAVALAFFGRYEFCVRRRSVAVQLCFGLQPGLIPRMDRDEDRALATRSPLVVRLERSRSRARQSKGAGP